MYDDGGLTIRQLIFGKIINMLCNKLYKSKKVVQQSICSSLSINDLELKVSLGWSKEERAKTQTIKLSLQLNFESPPLGCKTDELSETYCYDALIKKIETYLTAKSFRLIEHLAHTIYQFTKETIDQPILLTVCITKKPLINTLLGDVQFCYGDSPWSS